MPAIVRFKMSVRSIRRVRQIIGVLLAYGFDSLVEHLNLTQFVVMGKRLFRREVPRIVHLSPAVRMRLALEELGVTFIKLGQLLSTRSDLLPRSYVEEFAKLQDQVYSFSFAEVRKQIRTELGGEIEELFVAFPEEPMAAGSIAQVHRAVLPGGEDVVVKVRRPGIVEAVEADIDVLMGLALLAERRFPEDGSFSPGELVKEFSRSIRREMDLSREGHTIERFAANFADDPNLRFPRVHWCRTAEGVLTLEYIDGIKVADLDALERAGLDRKLIARRGAGAFLKQVLEYGFFHGDPHPGNIFVLPGNVLCLLDFGMIGRLEPSSREFLTEFLLSVINREPDRIISLLIYAGDITDIPDTRALKRDLSDFIDGFYELPLAKVPVGRVLMELIEIIATYRIRFRPDFMLLSKALVTIEGMGLMLDPEFNMVALLQPYVEKAAGERFLPGNIIKEAGTKLGAYFNLARNLPDDIKEILNRINRNKFKIDLEHRGLEHFIRELDKSGNRLSSSMIIAALIVGSSLIAQTGGGPQLLGLPVLALIGYSIAALMGVWLVIAIFRSGRL
jgi:ubiquinone biosynthesis protein